LSGCYGRAEAIGHVGELLQGAVRLGDRLEPFLVTLPAPGIRSQAVATQADAWLVEPICKTKALQSAVEAARRWNLPFCATITIRSAAPAGHGYGTSTSDCVAAIRALAALAERVTNSRELASIAVSAEGASDSTMFGTLPVVFLQRRGRCLRRFGRVWPLLYVLPRGLGGLAVDTLSQPMPEYTGEDLEEFRYLLNLAATGFSTGDARTLASVATRSAAIHQRHFPRPGYADLLRQSAEQAADGVAISHSGTAAALLFARPHPGCYVLGDTGTGLEDLKCPSF
jgi:uncharacterized protein involved in propanediol utilization